MKQLPKVFIALALVCVIIGLVIKVAAKGTIVPTCAWSWLKIAGLSLLFSIAIALAGKEK